ncbi:hypothetical protein [Archangium violaceum]|uniref:hypothetical protein n=1 Tax=Archangium violaceum TaxID=83451 RepID=UPI0036DA60E7
MIATLEEALFAAPVDPLLLLSILRHGQEGRHIILTDPSFQRNGQGAVNQWLAARDPLVRDAAEEALDRSLNSYNSTTTLAQFRVAARTQSHWAGTPPELTPEDAARVLALPLLLVLEDRQADKHFLRCVLPQPRRDELRAALERGWIRAEHGGGLGNMKKYVENLQDEPAERMRVWVLFDSDARQPAQPSRDSQDLKTTCASAVLPHHQLQRRSIENYLPPQALYRWAGQRRGVPGTRFLRMVQAFVALKPATERHHVDMKERFENDHIAELFREERFNIEQVWLQNDGQGPELDTIAQGIFERM